MSASSLSATGPHRAGRRPGCEGRTRRSHSLINKQRPWTKRRGPVTTNDVEQLGYDHAGRATSQTISHDGTDRAALGYAYNAGDQLTTQTDSGELTASHSYDYDTHGRLSADGSDAFNYDDAGNLTAMRGATLSYDAADRLTSTQAGDTTSYAYDESGNRTQTAPPTGPVTDYGYDQADQLTSVDDHTGVPITYTYAADGLRATKTKNTQTTNYTWDRSGGLPVLLAKDSTRYVYDPAGLALEQINSDGNVSYLHHDRLGSTRLVTNADGSTQATYSYDAYGNRSTESGSSSVPFGYAGQYTDTDTGLIYLRARYYDPATGQFLTRDPLETITNAPYAYANGDPVNNSDPSGLLSLSDVVQAIPAVGLAVQVANTVASVVDQGRLPDYVTVNVSAVAPVLGPLGVGAGGNLTVTRHGQVYVGPEFSAGLAGLSVSVRGGWINQSATPSACDTDQFVSGLGVTASGYVPAVLGVVGPSAGVTWGNVGATATNSTATEVGVGVGAGHNAGISVGLNFRLP